jgi:peptide/nickel transport system substrate-binding protein
VSVATEAETAQTDFALAGITLKLKAEAPAEVVAAATPCHGSGAGCSWDIDFPGVYSWTYDPPFYPTMEIFLKTDAGANFEGYSNPTNDALITASDDGGVSDLKASENFIANQVPVLFWPTPPYQVSVISGNLRGTLPQNPTGAILPEDWSLSS